MIVFAMEYMDCLELLILEKATMNPAPAENLKSQTEAEWNFQR